MANTAAAANNDSVGGIRSWPERIKSFYNDVRNEMRKVTAPSWKETQATTIVVIITVFLFGLYFFVIDNVIGRGVDAIFHAFTK